MGASLDCEELERLVQTGYNELMKSVHSAGINEGENAFLDTESDEAFPKGVVVYDYDDDEEEEDKNDDN